MHNQFTKEESKWPIKWQEDTLIISQDNLKQQVLKIIFAYQMKNFQRFIISIVEEGGE